MGFFSSITKAFSNAFDFVGDAVSEVVKVVDDSVFDPVVDTTAKIFKSSVDILTDIVPEAVGELASSYIDDFTAPIDAFLEGTPLKDAVSDVAEGLTGSVISGTLGGFGYNKPLDDWHRKAEDGNRYTPGSAGTVTLNSLKTGAAYYSQRQEEKKKAAAGKQTSRGTVRSPIGSRSYYGSRIYSTTNKRRVIYN